VLEAHAWIAVVAIAVASLAAVWGFVSWRRGSEPRALLLHLLALAQTLFVAQVGLGLLLLSDDRRSADELHYAYGTFALLAVLAPWMYAPREPRRRLLWFAGATLLAGALATRAYLTGG
jgi:hypothetical protein